MRILIDCDTGIDDSLALLYAIASPEAELVAVTCTAGNVDARQVAVNTRAVLELAGRTDVPVALGREAPLVRPLVMAPETHGPRGLGYADPAFTRETPGLSTRHAADVIVQEGAAAPGELTLVTLGPLSNVAVALEREPALPHLLAGLVMMVGAFRSPGNTAPTMEWNAGIDPEALDAVLVVGGRRQHPDVSRPRALGLDVTERAPMLPAHIDQLGPSPATLMPPWCASWLMPCVSTSSSTSSTTASTEPSSTMCWQSRRPSTRPSWRAALSRWRSSSRDAGPRAKRSPTGVAHGTADRTSMSPSRPTTDTFFERFIERVGRLARTAAGMSGQ